MATLGALLSTLAQAASSRAKAGEEQQAEELRKKQIYDQLETAAVQREVARRKMLATPQDDLNQHIAAMEKSLGRSLTDEEKQRYLGIAPKPTAGKVATKLIQDPASKTGWSFVSYDPMTGTEYSRQLDAPPQRGLIESETTTTDPLTGLTTVSHRKPILGGKPGGKPTPSPTPTQPRSTMDILMGATAPPPKLAGKRARGGREGIPATKPAALPAKDGVVKALPLDAEGHIPHSPLLNEHVREAANELLDGQDKLKIQPSKLADAAATLARRYGWEQGKFTPKEQTMLRETTTFLQRAMRDDSMSALDAGPVDRLRLQQIAQNPDKEGFIGRSVTMLASRGMTPSQQAFIQTYNQLVGTISGLAQLVRSGRATEATIERLKAELPNPTNTRDSKDAHERLQRLMDEINVAMQKGRFTGPESDQAQDIINRVLKK